MKVFLNDNANRRDLEPGDQLLNSFTLYMSDGEQDLTLLVGKDHTWADVARMFRNAAKCLEKLS